MNSINDREKSLISPKLNEKIDTTFRPEKLDQFIGQKSIWLHESFIWYQISSSMKYNRIIWNR